MLSATGPRPGHRPAGSGRRPAAALALLLGAVGLCVGCDREGRGFSVAAARAASQRAVVALRADDPAAARRVERLAASAERTTARQRGRLLGGDDDAVADAWGRTLRAARRGLRELEVRRADDLGRWRRALATAEAELARATEEATEPGIGRAATASLARARVALGLARTFAADGRVGRAADEAERAVELARPVHLRWQALHGRFGDGELLARWRRWAAETVEESRRRETSALVVDKLARRLHLYESGRRTASFTAELGANGLVDKRHTGDRATPEGRYRVVEKRDRGQTKYYRALLLDYPNRDDRERYARAVARGEIARGVGPGSLIEVHGEGGRGSDWTDGCVALANADMDRLWGRVREGTPVTIVGTLREER